MPPASVGAAYFISSSEPVPPANAVAADPAARAATPAPARKERRERVIFQILSSHKLAGDHLPPCSRLIPSTSHRSGSPGASCRVAWRLMYASTLHPRAPCSWPPGVSPRFFPTVFAGVEDPGHHQPEQRQPEGFPKLRIRSRALCGEDQQRGKSLRRASRTTFQLLTAVQGPYRAGKTACRTRRRGSGRASRSCRCWRRSRRS